MPIIRQAMLDTEISYKNATNTFTEVQQYDATSHGNISTDYHLTDVKWVQDHVVSSVYWDRTGTVLSTVTAGDSVELEGNITITNNEPTITLESDGGVNLPTIYFNRPGDSFIDWRVQDNGGKLYFSRSDDSGASWDDKVAFDGSDATFYNHEIIIERDSAANGYISFNNTLLTQEYSVGNSSTGVFRVEDITAGTVPFFIAPGATDNALNISVNGFVGVGSDAFYANELFRVYGTAKHMSFTDTTGNEKELSTFWDQSALQTGGGALVFKTRIVSPPTESAPGFIFRDQSDVDFMELNEDDIWMYKPVINQPISTAFIDGDTYDTLIPAFHGQLRVSAGTTASTRSAIGTTLVKGNSVYTCDTNTYEEQMINFTNYAGRDTALLLNIYIDTTDGNKIKMKNNTGGVIYVEMSMDITGL